MINILRKSAALCTIISSLFSAPSLSAEITVGAAISMSDAIEEISAVYTKKTGEKIRPTFSGTNVIARQIEAGAPIDVFISADIATMNRLVSGDFIKKSSVETIAQNRLVVVVPKPGKTVIEQPSDLQNLRQIALADPQSVPAGIYAKKWLMAEDLWKSIFLKIVPLQNVRAALIAVEMEHADAAIVYKSDAVSSAKVKIAYSVSEEKAGKIIYPAGIVSDSKKQDAASRYLEFLNSAEALEILTKYGFSAP